MRLLCLTIIISAAFLSYGIAAAGGASDGALGGISAAGLGVAAIYLFVLPRYFDHQGN